MNPAEIEAALARLGPEDRALLELSVIREVADDDIASLLGVDVEHVRTRREEALAMLGMRLGARSYDQLKVILKELRELPETRWRSEDGEPAEAPPEPVAAEPEPEPEPEPPAEEPEPEPEPERLPLGVLPDDPGPEEIAAAGSRATRPLLLVGLLAVVLLIGVVVAAGGGDDKPSAPAQAPPPQTSTSKGTGGAEAPKPKPAAKAVKLTAPVGGETGTGSGSITGSGSSARLDLTVSDLPPPADGGYVVWLYNSVFDARSLSGSLQRSFTVRKKLPADYRKFRFIDVSREPADGNRNHSGQSVLRVPISSLRP